MPGGALTEQDRVRDLVNLFAVGALDRVVLFLDATPGRLGPDMAEVIDVLDGGSGHAPAGTPKRDDAWSRPERCGASASVGPLSDDAYDLELAAAGRERRRVVQDVCALGGEGMGDVSAVEADGELAKRGRRVGGREVDARLVTGLGLVLGALERLVGGCHRRGDETVKSVRAGGPGERSSA